MKKLQLTRTVPGKEEVKELYRKEKDARLKERYHAMYLMHEFQNAGKVAELIGKTKMTLLKWVKAFNEVGIEGLLCDSPSGRPSQLSQEQKDLLKQDILRNPRELGYEFSNWEGKSVAFHISQKFGVHLGVRAAQKLLHKLGLSLQRPRPKLAQADPVAQDAFQTALKKSWQLSDRRGSSSMKMNAVSN